MARDFSAAGADGTYGQQRDLVLEVDEALDDDAALADAPALHRVVPRFGHILRTAQQRLPLAGRRHGRFDQARVADTTTLAIVDRRVQSGQRIGKGVGRGRQPQFFGIQPADAFTIHRQVRRACRRD